jgi:predicted N-acyltransferase
LKVQLHKGSKYLDQNQWEKLRPKENVFMSLDFKKTFEKFHQKQIQSIYYTVDDELNSAMGYAQHFIIGGNKIHSYQKKNDLGQSIISLVLRLLKLRVVALGNGLLTNISNLYIPKISDKSLFVKNLLNAIQEDFGVGKFIIPDHFFKALNIDNPNEAFPELIKIEVDEDMQMKIPQEWQTFEDYRQALKKKYRSRLKSVLKKSDAVSVKELDKEGLEKYAQKMQELFANVHQKSAFAIAPFHTDIYRDLIMLDNPQCLVFGYFLNDEMIAFSSELRTEKTLYSYFIGLDYRYNRSHRVYEKILNQTIKGAIEHNKQHLVFGRTAAEFKSNVGATPIQSHIYIYLKSPLLRRILRPVLSQIKPKVWTQRKPFA